MAGMSLPPRAGNAVPAPAPGRWAGQTYVPQAGADNDADQLSHMQRESDNAVAAGGGYSGSYTDSQGRVNHVNSPAPPKPLSYQLDDFSSLMSRFGNMGGGTNITGRGSLGQEPRVSLDTNAIDAGDAAAFSKAKDKVGGATQGLMKSLSNQFAARGLRGSSMEGREVGSALQSGAGQLDDVARDQAVEGSRRALDVAKTQYGGDITQRGQDLDAETANRSLDVTSNASRISSMLGLFNAFKGMKY